MDLVLLPPCRNIPHIVSWLVVMFMAGVCIVDLYCYLIGQYIRLYKSVQITADSCNLADTRSHHLLAYMKFEIDNLPVKPLHAPFLLYYLPSRVFARLSFLMTVYILVWRLMFPLPPIDSLFEEQYAYMCDLKRTLDATVIQ